MHDDIHTLKEVHLHERTWTRYIAIPENDILCESRMYPCPSTSCSKKDYFIYIPFYSSNLTHGTPIPGAVASIFARDVHTSRSKLCPSMRLCCVTDVSSNHTISTLKNEMEQNEREERKELSRDDNTMRYEGSGEYVCPATR